MKVSDILVQSLKEHGVTTVYGVPGEENLDFLDSLRKDGSIEFILTRNEQTAVFMAATYGRLTGKPGIALATLGPGATNMVTGVAYAQLWGMPVIVITGQKPIKTSKQGQFQIIDVVGMMRPITKYATTVISGSKLPYIMHNAFAIATAERPGAVHIELPEDIAEEYVENYIPLSFSEKVRRPQIDEKALEHLVNELSQAKTPLILIGAGANRKRVSKYLTKFITKYNIPFFCSQMGKGVVDESLPQYIGTAALTQNDFVHTAIAHADLILSVGYDPIEKPTTLLGAGGTKTIHINYYETSHDYVYHPYLEIIGDIGNTFRQLSDNVDISQARDFSQVYPKSAEYLSKLDHDYLQEHIGNGIMWPRELAHILRQNLQKDDILTLDNGLYKVWFARHYRCFAPNTLLLDNALATMGAGLSSAMEAKRLFPEKKVICLTGDGWLVMNLGDLETAVRMQIDLVVIVARNNSYGMIAWKQRGSGFSEGSLDFGNPDFKLLAESFWATGYRVDDKKEFETTLQQAMKNKGITIIDLAFDYPATIS